MEGGGRCASPGPADVLQCESAGLGWPLNVQTPCAGLPRRLRRGACAGAPDDRGRDACDIVLRRQVKEAGARPSDRSASPSLCRAFATGPCSCRSDSRFGVPCRDYARPCCQRSPGPRAQHLDGLCPGCIEPGANGRRTPSTRTASADWSMGQQPSQSGTWCPCQQTGCGCLFHAFISLPPPVPASSRCDVEWTDIQVHCSFQQRDGCGAESNRSKAEWCPGSSRQVARTDSGQLGQEDREARAERGYRRPSSGNSANLCQPTNLSRRGWPPPVWKELSSKRAISSIDKTTAYRPDFFYRRNHAKTAETFLQTTRFAAPKSLMPDGATEWQTRKDMAAWMI